jgi:hypothetical protein
MRNGVPSIAALGSWSLPNPKRPRSGVMGSLGELVIGSQLVGSDRDSSQITGKSDSINHSRLVVKLNSRLRITRHESPVTYLIRRCL